MAEKTLIDQVIAELQMGRQIPGLHERRSVRPPN